MSRFSDSGYGVQSSGNTTVALLGSSATFTGASEQNPFPDVMCSCYSDTDGTLYFDFSVNGTDWRTFPVQGFSVSAGIHEFHTAVKGPRYFRVRFVNSASAQTVFQLYTYYGALSKIPNSPLNQSQGLDADSVLTRPTSAQDEITRGLRSGVSQWNKFGYRDNLTAGGGEQTIWASSSNLAIMTTAETFDISYNNATDGDGTTGATELTFYYLDANERLAVATHTLGSTGSDTTAFTGLGINRCVVTGSGSNNTNASDITITNTTSGNDQATLPAGGGVTQQAFFFCPDNGVAATKWLEINANRSAGGAAPIIRFKGYVYNRTVDSAFEVFRYIMDTNIEEEKSFNDPCNFPLSPRDVIYFVADTDRNNTEVNLRFSLNLYDNV